MGLQGRVQRLPPVNAHVTYDIISSNIHSFIYLVSALLLPLSQKISQYLVIRSKETCSTGGSVATSRFQDLQFSPELEFTVRVEFCSKFFSTFSGYPLQLVVCSCKSCKYTVSELWNPIWGVFPLNTYCYWFWALDTSTPLDCLEPLVEW